MCQLQGVTGRWDCLTWSAIVPKLASQARPRCSSLVSGDVSYAWATASDVELIIYYLKSMFGYLMREFRENFIQNQILLFEWNVSHYHSDHTSVVSSSHLQSPRRFSCGGSSTNVVLVKLLTQAFQAPMGNAYRASGLSCFVQVSHTSTYRAKIMKHRHYIKRCLTGYTEK